ncbi:hypothetical protein [Polynucleobacter sp. JS-Fieb-80-E5]|uniref:hypothetical protein n=1 Tax=Polynucleobacter sp. JS-Fieb-80-E5 TaxID=2081050 RepID=UPI001C0D3AF0|nr:hypothetical protein [Polynucleobacter sp. JS-Fieb-80-E5]MBU3618173.1 hypothetical protein [Polynucleobacter sp. JS-Fieb-80-E5]
MKKYIAFLYLGLIPLLSAAQLPPLQMSNETRFIEGGVGQSESDAIKMEAKRWPLFLEFSQTNGNKSEWVSNVLLVLKDANGVQLLSHQVDGPFILVDLKPGKYSSESTYGTQKLLNNFYVTNGQHKKMNINWR